MSASEIALIAYFTIGLVVGYLAARETYRHGGKDIPSGTLRWALMAWFNTLFLWPIFPVMWLSDWCKEHLPGLPKRIGDRIF